MSYLSNLENENKKSIKKYTFLKNQIIWACTHYGLVPIEGIIKILENSISDNNY